MGFTSQSLRIATDILVAFHCQSKAIFAEHQNWSGLTYMKVCKPDEQSQPLRRAFRPLNRKCPVSGLEPQCRCF